MPPISRAVFTGKPPCEASPIDRDLSFGYQPPRGGKPLAPSLCAACAERPAWWTIVPARDSLMRFKKIIVTGGAGFVGAHLAVLLKQAFGNLDVTACDNLKRRGSELNLARLARSGVLFQHGDIRCPEDVSGWPEFDLLIDC